MNSKIKKKSLKIIFWTSRVLAILLILFISIFAFDVFDAGYSFWLMLGALLIHLIPSFLLVGVTLLAWRNGYWGGAGFILLALFYTIWAGGKGHLDWILFIAGPGYLIGGMFILDQYWKKYRD